MSETTKCPVCEEPECSSPGYVEKDTQEFNCKCCGLFRLSGTANSILLGVFSRKERAYLSHVAANIGLREIPYFDSYNVESIMKEAKFFSPMEQAEHIILHIGDILKENPAEYKYIYLKNLKSIAGSNTVKDLHYVIKHLSDEKILQQSKFGLARPQVEEVNASLTININLTFLGWQKYDELKRHTPKQRRKAFMAMQFNNDKLQSFLEDHFKPAVKKTGYDLEKLTDNQRAGLIDDQLRVKIRNSRFLIADLSDANNGAYWEAGFAEGIGIPVIYTCEKEVFEDEKRKPHFDTNHHLTVLWDSSNPDESVEKLKATIRATLPEPPTLMEDDDKN